MGLEVRPGLEIPDADLEVAFIRSSGPGGQNVNKVASAVQLRFALERNVTLHPDVKARLRILASESPLKRAAGCAAGTWFGYAREAGSRWRESAFRSCG